jgi:ABC-type phosphate transport system ATPase subunit
VNAPAPTLGATVRDLNLWFGTFQALKGVTLDFAARASRR